MAKRALLLDRDGVINIDHGYVGSIDKFVFISGIFPFLRQIQDIGYRLAILTNQAGVGRGYYTKTDYETLTAWMLEEFHKQHVFIDLVLASFEHPEGLADIYRRESYWR